MHLIDDNWPCSKPIPADCRGCVCTQGKLYQVRRANNQPGVGSLLKAWLAWWGFSIDEHCGCTTLAQLLDIRGPRWCRANCRWIAGVLHDNFQRRATGYVQHCPTTLVKWAAHLLVYLAVLRSSKKYQR